MSKKQKLELTWIGKDEQAVLEPRILIEDPEKSYGDPHSENMLIHGDNLLALKALEQKFAGKVKCIYIDPPYNTGSAFEHYDDGVEHSLWLSLMRDRLVLLRNLLSDDGSLWITIDDNECHYLKVLCDEIFGRNNFVANVMWEKKFSPQNDAKWLSLNHDHILLFSKNKEIWRPSLLARSQKQEKNFKNPDNDLRGMWSSADYTCAKSKDERPNLYYPILNPNTGKEVWPKPIRVWAFDKNSHERNVADNLLWWGKDGRNPVPRLKKFADRVREGTVPTTVWRHEDVGNNQTAKREVISFNKTDPFATPKPESLIQRVLEISTNPGDWVLDSFLGSGTTAAVAHKMGRKWIGIELGDHCDTHCVPRLQKVCDGTDQGGISKAVDWKGGGGFKYYDLAPSLLKQDAHGNFIISEEYNADMLAAAMAKQEGFTYRPDAECYWKQGFSTEQDFVFTTTNHVTHAMLDLIAEEMAEGEHLLICCKKYSAGCETRHPNIQVKKIPAMLMGRCEFGKEDYSLNIVNLTDEAAAPEFVPEGPGDRGQKSEDGRQKSGKQRQHGNKNPNQQELF
ncbi:MAG: site-specific DNA-methyltransferase [Spartobacteria bacterium]|nr:site-specific DNA-methyltransferase [Spartobacteria bacterium]